MNHLIEAEDVVEAAKSFLDCNRGDEATENLIIAMCCELLDVSQDQFMEMINQYINSH